MSDYLDLMPNFKEKVEKWKLQPELNTLRQEDGKFYVLPGMHENLWPDYTLAFRTDELQRLGLSAPKTWDEVYTVLKAIKAAHPDSYPLSDRFEGKAILNYAAGTFGTRRTSRPSRSWPTASPTRSAPTPRTWSTTTARR
ncbi:extracellular solute-binding protein [Saccharothrix syringae]|uniref:extracellular solute-binding protein n=1 Tax=Saccharothrix syringae TaxID=103733 RepID=UPI001B80E5F3|nr:extracellular solute-binding protein [Saccharothrix syringae]